MAIGRLSTFEPGTVTQREVDMTNGGITDRTFVNAV